MALKDSLDMFEKSLKRLEDAYLKAKSVETRSIEDYSFFRDSAIQRFEFTVEIFWKTLKEFLKEKEGIESRTPKSAIREFFSAGFIDEDNTSLLLEMVDDRNLTSHTYREDIAEEIFSKLERYINRGH